MTKTQSPPMPAATLEALRGSIRKWERIEAGTGKDRGVRNCPLCKLFYEDYCRGCPVSECVHRNHCGGTPYEKWESVAGEDGIAVTPALKKLARAELAFLKSLLPKGKRHA